MVDLFLFGHKKILGMSEAFLFKWFDWMFIDAFMKTRFWILEKMTCILTEKMHTWYLILSMFLKDSYSSFFTHFNKTH